MPFKHNLECCPQCNALTILTLIFCICGLEVRRSDNADVIPPCLRSPCQQVRGLFDVVTSSRKTDMGREGVAIVGVFCWEMNSGQATRKILEGRIGSLRIGSGEKMRMRSCELRRHKSLCDRRQWRLRRG